MVQRSGLRKCHVLPIALDRPLTGLQRINDFGLLHWEDNGDWTRYVSTVDHWLNMTAGTDSTLWKVPTVKDKGFVVVRNFAHRARSQSMLTHADSTNCG